MAKPTKSRVIKPTPQTAPVSKKLPAIQKPIPAPMPAVPPPAAPPDGSIYGASKRWTEDLVKDGFTPVSDYFLKNYASLNPPISTGEALFIVHLVSFKWTTMAPRPSMRRIAERMGVSEVSVRNYARSLEQKKYLLRVMRVGLTNQFRLRPLFSVLEAHRRANQHTKSDPDDIED